MTDLIVIAILLIGLIAEVLLFEYIIHKKSCGEIVMQDDLIYLNINKEDIDKFKNNESIMLLVKRRNFNGFNE